MVRPEPFWYNKVQIVLHDLIKAADKKHGDMFEEPLPCHLISRRGKKFALTTAPNTGGIVSCIVCVWGWGWGESKKVAMIGGGPQQGGRALLGGHPLSLRGQFSCQQTTGLLATKLLLLGCKATRDSARESNISKCYFVRKQLQYFTRRLILQLRCPGTNESVLRVVVLVQGKSHSPSSHPNYNQTKRAITLKWPHITTLQPVFSGQDTASTHAGAEQIKFLIDPGIN